MRAGLYEFCPSGLRNRCACGKRPNLRKCSLCCKVVGVEEIAKAGGVWCHHARRSGCSIYSERYASCRSFYCVWMTDSGLGPEWKPERAKFALVRTNSGPHLTACVDPGFPTAWRRSPYYDGLKQWAIEGARRSPDLHLVDVMIADRWIAILPDRDVDIGVLANDEAIQITSRPTGRGEVMEVCKVKRASLAAVGWSGE
jgi:hypothetical protein